MLVMALFAGCGTWIGISVGSPTLIGKTEDASLSLLAVRYARAVLQRPDFSLHYTADLIPFAHLNERKRQRRRASGAGTPLSAWQTRAANSRFHRWLHPVWQRCAGRR